MPTKVKTRAITIVRRTSLIRGRKLARSVARHLKGPKLQSSVQRLARIMRATPAMQNRTAPIGGEVYREQQNAKK